MVSDRSLSARINDDDDADESEDIGEQANDFQSGFISILGNPNVGKSTLMNRLLGERLCIISPKPQTTRHRILGILSDKNDKYQLIFSDTPGMMIPAYKLQEAMMTSVRGAAGDADIVLLVTDVYGENLFDEKVLQTLQVTSKPIVIVINKVDLIGNEFEDTVSLFHQHVQEFDRADRADKVVDKPRRRLLLRRSDRESVDIKKSSSAVVEEEIENNVQASIDVSKQTDKQTDTESMSFVEEYVRSLNNDEEAYDKRGEKKHRGPLSIDELVKLWKSRLPRAQIVPIAAGKEKGVNGLLKNLISLTPTGPKYFPSDALTNRDERFFASEIIREALFHCYKDEIPYSCEIRIESFADKTPALSVIEATIIVSRESQKGILIGKKGSKLKELGTQARKGLEEFLSRKVYLSLRVKVDEDWRSSGDSLQKYGYVDSDFG